MATQPIPVLKETFSDNKEPNGQDFGNLIDSFDHKSIPLPQSRVLGLAQSFEEKADKTQVAAIESEIPNLATKDELQSVVAGLNPMGEALNIADLNTKPKRNNDSYFVLDQLNENGDPYIFRYDAELDEWINTKQVVYKNVATKSDLEVKADKTAFPLEYHEVALNIQNGFYDYQSGNFRADNGWRSAELILSIVGREIYATGLHNNTGAALAVYMNGNTFLSYEFRGTGANIKYEKQLLTIPREATRVLLTAYYGVNGSESTSPILGAYTKNVAKDILTEQTADIKYNNKEDLNSARVFKRIELSKVDGFISPNGGLNSGAGYSRAKVIITKENKDNLYFTGVQSIKGAVIAAYFDSNDKFLSAEPETDGTFTFYSRHKLNVPEQTAYAWIGGDNSVGFISTYDFFVEQSVYELNSASALLNQTISKNATSLNRVAFLDNAYVYAVKYANRWFRSWLKVQNDNTVINALSIPIVRNVKEDKLFTDDIIVGVVTSTGYTNKKVIPLAELKKYNEIDVYNVPVSELQYTVDLGEAIQLNAGDWVQITFYCKATDDRMQLMLRYAQKDSNNNVIEPDSAFYTAVDKGFYRDSKDTELTDADLITFQSVSKSTDWGHYSGIGFLTITEPKQNIEVLMPRRIYTVCNDSGTTGADVRNNRHYSAMLQLDHSLNNLLSEPKDLRFLNNGQDRLLFYAPIISTAYGDAPTFNNNQNILKQNRLITVGGGVYNEQIFNIEHISVKNSITKAYKPRVLCIGDSITVGEGDPSNVYHLLTKELFYLDWVDNGKIAGEHEILFVGRSKNSKTVTYKGETETISTYREGITGMSSGDETIFYDAVSGKYTLKNWLAKYRTMDDNGNRLASDSPNKGTDVTNVNAYDVCLPNNIVFAMGANDSINYDWLSNVKKFIADIKAEYVSEGWGDANIGIVHPDSAGTYFPSLHPELSDDMYYWNVDNEGRHSRFWKFANDWLNDKTYNEDTDRVFYIPFMFTSPCDVAKNRPVTLPDGEPIHVPFGWGATTHVYEKAYRHWAYQLYSWIKYAMSL